MNQSVQDEYIRWKERADPSLQEELSTMDEGSIQDVFYSDLTFGTGGLRGVLGAGTNRMNLHTVAKATQGLANYITTNVPSAQRSVAISYDSRLLSDTFAHTAASVLAAAGIQVWLYPELMPTPCLSFAVRELGCTNGVMITASHNPAKYNGYKVYGADGCQITQEAADAILGEIRKLDIFEDVYCADFQQALSEGQIRYISNAVTTAYIEAVKAQSLLGEDKSIVKDYPIVYTPLNGTGRKPVLRVLAESGYTNVTIVKEQALPDGNFPTCPCPNPEIPEAMTLGMEYARRNQADLLLATDPDCDRIGVAVRNGVGDFVLLDGNQLGILLLDYICKQVTMANSMPSNPVFIKTIVTTDLAERIAAHYGVKTINVLTGFKYIGEQIGFLEQVGAIDSYLFGFEESCGYLKGTYVRDKDAVVGALLVCEMFSWYRSMGIRLTEQLETLYRTYGYCFNSLMSYEFDGFAGAKKISTLMDAFRNGRISFRAHKIMSTIDYAHGLCGLPKANVLKLELDGNATVTVRPSGTEPKLKFYLSVYGDTPDVARQQQRALQEDLHALVDAIV